MKKLKKITVGECFTLYIDKLIRFKNQSGLINCLVIWPDKSRKRNLIANVLQKKEMDLIFSYILFSKGTNYQKLYEQKIELEKTECNYGGYKYWFLCPNCNDRIGIIYLPPGEKYLACRECYGLTYKSRQLHKNREYERNKYSKKLDEVDEKLTKMTAHF